MTAKPQLFKIKRTCMYFIHAKGIMACNKGDDVKIFTSDAGCENCKDYAHCNPSLRR